MPKEIFCKESFEQAFLPLFSQYQHFLTQNLGFSFTEKEIEKSLFYANEMLEKNQYMNLTALTTAEKVFFLHFIDSLYLEHFMQAFFQNSKENWREKKMADVGTGAGFPAFYLHTLFPKKSLFLMDALKKRLVFLEELQEKFKHFSSENLVAETKVHFVHGRAEDLGQNVLYREKMDIVCARAVASLPTLLEYCMPLVAEGGYFFAMKGAKDELSMAENALAQLESECVKTYAYTLPFENEERKIYVFQKKKKISKKYPRKSPLPFEKPL